MGDGTSRNPPDRDELIAQRTKDAEGLMGQVRGFDLHEYLSDWEQNRFAQPWTLPSDSLPAGKDKGRKKVAVSADPSSDQSMSHDEMVAAMADGGVLPRLKVLYVPDFLPQAAQREHSGRLFRDLSTPMPNRDISMGSSQGPFEDDLGDGAHFEGRPRKLTEDKLRLEMRKDLLTSMVKALRSCGMHRPEIVFGEGQGARVALSLVRPLFVEAAMQARNIQRKEVQELAEAWNNIKLIIIRLPRMFKARGGYELWKACSPEFEGQSYPAQPLPVVGVRVNQDPFAEDTKRYWSRAGCSGLRIRRGNLGTLTGSGEAHYLGPQWHLCLRQEDIPVRAVSEMPQDRSCREDT